MAEIQPLSFLYNRLSLAKWQLRTWLSVPEFVDAMLDRVSTGVRIDDSVVLSVMMEVYNNRYTKVSETGINDLPFSFFQLRRGINRLIKVLHPDQYDELKVRRGVNG